VIKLKGITPVIAIILLLLITISMVGFAFIWFQRVQSTMTNSTESELQQQLNKQGQKLTIDNVAATSVTFRSSGTASVGMGSVGIYVDNVAVTLSGTGCTGADSLAPAAIRTCTISASCDAGSSLKVTSPGGYIDIANC
jgi:flagellin-like protein